MASDRHDSRGRRFTVATTKNRRLTQEQLDVFRDAPAKTPEQELPRGKAAPASDDKTIPDPPRA
jgi:hypothetical protein